MLCYTVMFKVGNYDTTHTRACGLGMGDPRAWCLQPKNAESRSGG